MKKDNNFLGKFLLYLFTLFSVFYMLFTCIIFLKCYAASRTTAGFLDQEFLRFKIYGSTSNFEGNTVSATISIIDSNGNEIAVIERSWSGSYLAVEFAQVRLNGSYYIFPSRIYGKNRIIEEKRERRLGTRLEKYYTDNNQCMLAGYGSTYSQRKALYVISALATRRYPIMTFGTTTSYAVDLSNCLTDRYYSIRIDEKLNIVIDEL